jgi:long-chain acyl-CoA synthetase
MLNPLIWILWLLDFIVWLVYFLVIGWLIAIIRLATAPGYGKQVADGAWRSAYCDTTTLHRSPGGPDAKENVKTAWDCFDAAFKKFANTNCMGTRKYVGTHRKEKGHKIVKKIFAETSWKTYGQIGARAEAFGRGLLSTCGMEPSPSKSKADFEASSAPDTLLLWEDTCADWMTCAAGAFSQSLVVATSYATLGVEGVLEAVNQCECPVVVCNRSKVEELVAAREKLDGEAKARLATIVYTDLNQGGSEAFGYGENLDLGDVPAAAKLESLPRLEIQVEGLQVLHFDDVVAAGNAAEAKEKAPTRPSPETMAVVMYTSGSTGKPKGVLIRHSNLCASVAGMHANFSTWGAEGQEVYLAYLPAAHILELVAEIAMLSFGSTIGYADPRSIASTGACRFYNAEGKDTINFEANLQNSPGGIQEFKPTCLAAVPKIWDILKKSIEEKIGDGSCVLRTVFEAAFAACNNAQAWRSCPLLGLLFTKVIGGIVGGRMKCGISGGGPISPEVQNFCRVAFGFPLIQGYALTETTCAGCVQLTADSEDGIVGAPLPSVEIKLADCPDVNDRNGKPYMSSDTSHWDGMTCKGRGEVWIRGPSVSMGYYAKGDQAESLTKKTVEEFSSEAPNQDASKDENFDWFHSGDIGLFTPDGRLKLVDRKKNLVKLAGGEYIAIEQMESQYGTSKFVDAKRGGICVFGDGTMDKPVALMIGNIPALEAWAKENGVNYDDDDSLCANADVNAMVLKEMQDIAKAKLAMNEKICAIAIISGSGPEAFPGNEKSPWTPENGFLTASNKIDRNSIYHGKVIDGQTSGCFESVLVPMCKKAGAKEDYGPAMYKPQV